MILNVLLTTVLLTTSVNGIWDTLYAANRGKIYARNFGLIFETLFFKITASPPPPQYRRRSSTDANGQLLFGSNEINWDEQNAVTPSSFSEIFTGQQNVVLVKKAEAAPMLPRDTFVPLPSVPPTILQVSSTTTTPTTTTAVPTQSYPMTTASTYASSTASPQVSPLIITTTEVPTTTVSSTAITASSNLPIGNVQLKSNL